MDAHEVLVKARNLIDRVGWVQGSHGSHAEGYCAEGAISCAGRGVPDGYFHGPEMDAFQALAMTVRISPHAFNDEPERTKAEVLAAFDRAIAATSPLPADPFTSTDNLPECRVREMV